MSKHLTQRQRYIISYLKETKKQCEIAKEIGVSKSTVSRELRRNLLPLKDEYDPEIAQLETVNRHKEKRKRSDFTVEMREIVKNLLQEGYSPEQISGRCRLENIKMVSHETIYL